MAFRTTTFGQRLQINSGPTSTGPFTVMWWVKFYSPATNWTTLLGRRPGFEFGTVNTILDNTQWYIETGGSGAGSFARTASFTTGVWYSFALSYDGTTLSILVDGEIDATRTGLSFGSLTDLSFGGDSGYGDATNGAFAGLKYWDGVALSQTEIQAEMTQLAPVREENIWAWWPCFVGERGVDYSGNGRDLSDVGTITDEEGPPIPLDSSSEPTIGTAIQLGGSGQYLLRAANLPSSPVLTIAAWVRIRDLTAQDGEYFLGYENAISDATSWHLVGYYNGVFDYAIAGGSANPTAPPLNTWLFVAITNAGAGTDNAKLYYGQLGDSLTVVAQPGQTFTPAAIFLGNDSWDEWASVDIGPVYIYDAALSQAELEAQRSQIVPLRTADINLWSPLLGPDDVADYSGKGRDWTVGGTLASTDGPPIPWTVTNSTSIEAQSAGRTAATCSLTVAQSLVADQAGQTTEQVAVTVSRSMTAQTKGATATISIISSVTAIQGQSAGRNTAAGSLTVSRSITGQAAGSSVATGIISTAAVTAIQGQSAGRTGATSTLTVSRSLVVDQAGRTTEQVTATLSRSMSSTAAGRSEATSVISSTTVIAIQAQSAGRTTAAGSLTVSRSLTTAPSGRTTEQVTATISRSITAQAKGTTEIAGVISSATVIAIQAQATGRTETTGTLTVSRSMTIAPTGRTTEQVTATLSRSMSSAAAGRSEATGVLSSATVTAIHAHSAGRTGTTSIITVTRLLIVDQAGRTTEQVTAILSRSMISTAAGATKPVSVVASSGIRAATAGATQTTALATVQRSITATAQSEMTVAGPVSILRRLTATCRGGSLVVAILTVSQFEIELDPDRTYVIPAENRVYVIPAEDRTYTILAEDRTYLVEADN